MFCVMVFAILIGAPFCATWIQVFGKRWLTFDEMIPTDDNEYEGGRHELISEPTGLGILNLAKQQMELIALSLLHSFKYFVILAFQK